MIFSDQDIQQITEHGLTIQDAEHQIADFVRGFPYADIVEPATIANNGIQELNYDARQKYIGLYQEYAKTHTVVKFVPASGAATRMLRDLFTFLDTGELNDVARKVCEHARMLAMYDELNLDANATNTDIARAIVDKYGNMPKGLVPFHKYTQNHNGFNEIRTPIAEHLYEGAKYAVSQDNTVNIHFTVSPEHHDAFQELLDKIVPEYTNHFGKEYNVTMSEQESSTDTIAVNPDNTPFRAPDGKLVFRPAGHGALIRNLNNIDADIIFIKNIDNICTMAMAGDTIEYKGVLAGLLVFAQTKVFEYLHELDNENADMNKISDFIKNTFGVDVAPNRDELRTILNRPLRVCGMVKNTGAPGGGPFWVKNAGLQIIESSQIAPDARDIMNKSTHFNPVDLVCSVRDYMGNRFNLMEFIDENTGFISDKSYFGRPIRAMERPGLWNGAMAKWNTVFVEVPVTTFNPVKTIADLLTPAHND